MVNELMPSERRPRRSPPPSRSGVLVVLLLMTLGLAATLAYEAHDAVRSHRATAERALRDYAYFAASEFLATAKENVHDALTAALSPLTEGKALSPYEPLPPPAALARTAADVLRCERASDDSARFYFRLDLRDGALTTSGATPSAAMLVWVADTVVRHVRSTYQSDWRYAPVFGRVGGERVVIVYGLKYAEFGAPLAAFGFSTCPSAFGVPLFRDVIDRHALLPRSLTQGVDNDSLLSVAVFDAAGREVYRSSPAADTAFTGEVTMETLGGLTARVALRAAAAESLPVGSLPRPRLPLLVGLLALTAALVVIALLQLRRESELARLRADFTSSVSHELRTPLSQIVLFAETLSLGRVRSERERREAATVILQEARRLMHLVENVLFFSRAERRANHAAPRPTLVGSAVAGIVAGFVPLAEESETAIALALEGDPAAMVDPGALRQMLLNLLDNAVKYGPPGQTVTVGARPAGQDGGRVRVWVEDQGPGIPPQERERVWLPFLRLQRDRNGANGGSGIGLAVVRELALLHGGETWVEGGTAGGARFVIELPATSRVRAGAGGGSGEADADEVDAGEADATSQDATAGDAPGAPGAPVAPRAEGSSAAWGGPPTGNLRGGGATTGVESSPAASDARTASRSAPPAAERPAVERPEPGLSAASLPETVAPASVVEHPGVR